MQIYSRVARKNIVKTKHTFGRRRSGQRPKCDILTCRQCKVCMKSNTSYHPKHTIPVLKLGGKPVTGCKSLTTSAKVQHFNKINWIKVYLLE